jgi:hypothetical protein
MIILVGGRTTHGGSFSTFEFQPNHINALAVSVLALFEPAGPFHGRTPYFFGVKFSTTVGKHSRQSVARTAVFYQFKYFFKTYMCMCMPLMFGYRTSCQPFVTSFNEFSFISMASSSFNNGQHRSGYTFSG